LILLQDTFIRTIRAGRTWRVMTHVVRAGRTCLDNITRDIHLYHTSWPYLKDNDLVSELGWAGSVSYELAGRVG
jgi:hypothetical protein